MTNDDERLDRAIRASLRDLVDAAPTRDDVPVRAGDVGFTRDVRRRPWLVGAAALTAAAGIIAVVAVTSRDPITTETAEQSVLATPTPSEQPAAAMTTSTLPTTTTTSAPEPEPGPPTRVIFPSGSNNQTMTNQVSADRTDRYVLEAAAGQTMVVSLETADPDSTLSVFAPGGTTLAEGRPVADVDLPADGDYLVEVRTTGEGGEYTITFLID